ncbi:MAG: hypothetical protein IJH68_08550 [Thermoguttaceae bacterium]|nr:hypothetical protein [Thermoguttaceae bacterium]
MSTPAVITPTNLAPMAEVSNFEVQLKRAEIMANAPFLPDAFRGNPGAVLIAVELADRLALPVMAVCQSIYVVHGKPAFSGSFYISCINASGRFSPVDYEEQRDGEKLTGCRVTVTRRGTGKQVYGPWVTLEMAEKEGWIKNNPKWRSMPELMLRYRAASFFARTFCPDVVLGFAVEGEAEDIAAAEAGATGGDYSLGNSEGSGSARCASDEEQRDEQLPKTSQGSKGRRASRPVTVDPNYKPDIKVIDYAERLSAAMTMADLQAVEIEIGTDNKLGTADLDFLRPIAAQMRKSFDK